ncbi:hypothetical protein P3T36_002585 [Kitasatospora sp. MAP12-15]|nr:hypothetical protein [Kitasatospora sp. MAP12-44]
MSWDIILTPEVHNWFLSLPTTDASLVRDSIELLAD